MSGPCSLPNGNKAEWEKMNEKVCNIHKYCWPERPVGDEDTRHEWVTLRIWLANRKKLRTGKTV